MTVKELIEQLTILHEDFPLAEIVVEYPTYSSDRYNGTKEFRATDYITHVRHSGCIIISPMKDMNENRKRQVGASSDIYQY